jgi:tetratricopeptide (TPR) repeat protein
MYLLICNPTATQRELATTLVSLGSTASALEVFERLQLWEDVITCYHSIGRSGKAESIIREQLLQKETPTMWCLLGDVTKDGQYYQKAWEVSGQRSSRAQRSLGMLHLRGKKFAECVQCLRKSTNINFLQEGVWFSMGYAANEIGDYDTALESFHNCVTLEPDHGEAWNNLAAIYIKKKNKSKAHLMLQESLKQNFENWKVWENYLLVSTDTGAFKDAITAFHRLIDLKEKYYDVEVLGHLVAAIVGNMVDNSGQKVSHLRKDLGELCGRIVSKVSTDPLVWKLYSDFHLSSDSEEDREKGVLELQKAQRLTRQREGWETNETQLMKVFQLTVQYSRGVCVCVYVCTPVFHIPMYSTSFAQE